MAHVLATRNYDISSQRTWQHRPLDLMPKTSRSCMPLRPSQRQICTTSSTRATEDSTPSRTPRIKVLFFLIIAGPALKDRILRRHVWCLKGSPVRHSASCASGESGGGAPLCGSQILIATKNAAGDTHEIYTSSVIHLRFYVINFSSCACTSRAVAVERFTCARHVHRSRHGIFPVAQVSTVPQLSNEAIQIIAADMVTVRGPGLSLAEEAGSLSGTALGDRQQRTFLEHVGGIFVLLRVRL